MTFGDFELTAVSDGAYHLDGGAFFGVVPKVMWERRFQPTRITGTHGLEFRGGAHRRNRRVLIETGIGNKLPTAW